MEETLDDIVAEPAPAHGAGVPPAPDGPNNTLLRDRRGAERDVFMENVYA